MCLERMACHMAPATWPMLLHMRIVLAGGLYHSAFISPLTAGVTQSEHNHLVLPGSVSLVQHGRGGLFQFQCLKFSSIEPEDIGYVAII